MDGVNGIARLMVFGVLALSAAGCGRSKAEAAVTTSAAATATEPAPSAAPAPPAVPQPVSQVSAQTTMVSFVKGKLSECTDISFTLHRAEGSKSDWESVAGAKVKEGIAQFTKKVNPSSVESQSRCAEQFKDRLRLASCRVSYSGKTELGSTAIVAESSYYKYEDIYSSDEFMRECMEMKGKWEALPKDSPEVASARRNDLAERLMKAAE